jgi:2-amino-4-hydroxy-6-hydroxymethyldihydropteridine diphosphokinase
MIHFIAVGANLPGLDGAEPRAMCERAIRWMSEIPEICVQARSRWFSSAAVPASDQPRFINGVVRLAGQISPEDLLAALQVCERRAGRARSVVNEARPLDLDIIDMAGLLRDAPDPILPHPRAHERAFVLYPLRDVAPHWVHPRSGSGIETLLSFVRAQDVRAA